MYNFLTAFIGCDDNGDCIKEYVRQRESKLQISPDLLIRNQTAFRLCVDMIRTVDQTKKPKKVYKYNSKEFYKALRKHPYCKTITDDKGLNLLAIIILEGRVDFLVILLYCGILMDMLDVKITSETYSRFSGMTPKEIVAKCDMKILRDEFNSLIGLEKSLTPLHCAARSGDVEIVKFALERHPEMMETPAKDGSNALLWAVTSGNLEVVKVKFEYKFV